MSTIVSKVLALIHAQLATPSEAVKSVLHICSHWFDSAIAFRILGVKGATIPGDYADDHKASLIRAD